MKVCFQLFWINLSNFQEPALIPIVKKYVGRSSKGRGGGGGGELNY